MGQLTVLQVLYLVPLGLDPRAFVIHGSQSGSSLEKGDQLVRKRERDHAVQRIGQSPFELMS